MEVPPRAEVCPCWPLGTAGDVCDKHGGWSDDSLPNKKPFILGKGITTIASLWHACTMNPRTALLILPSWAAELLSVCRTLVSSRSVRAQRAVAGFSSLHLIQHLWQNSTKTVTFFAPHHWKISMYSQIPPGNMHIFMPPSSTLDHQPVSSASS